ncbi:MAG: hypothetical protein J6D54_13600 [Olsenella sp.]|nr:hypothetical protein [Olsenella sp.]
MTATDELRRLLDERGVEHYDGTEMTLWLKDEHGYRASANELHSGRLSVHVWCDTPEHAIEATLGRGECRECASMDDVFECSACGARYESWALKRFASYCPDCGRKVRA